MRIAGIFINCSAAPFVDQIIAHTKTDETRPRDMLKRLAGQRIALIETGTHQTPIVKGYATITGARTVTHNNTAARQAAQIIGTPYDIQPGRTKCFYHLADVEPVTPYQLPEARENHGRAWTVYEIPAALVVSGTGEARKIPGSRQLFVKQRFHE